MRNILYDLYFGKITPWETKTTEPFVKEAVKKAQEAHHEFEKQLPESLIPIFQKFCSAESEMHTQSLYAEYIRGFKTGVKLMSAVFEDDETDFE